MKIKTTRRQSFVVSNGNQVVVVVFSQTLVALYSFSWKIRTGGQLVSANKELYLKLPNQQKQFLSNSIVHAVRSQNPPGRFLQKHPQTDLWYDVGDNRALEKTSQALREGAPKLKQKMKQPPVAEGEGKSEVSESQEAGESNKPDAFKSQKTCSTFGKGC